METLEGLEVPNGYERELIIIRNQAFSIIEKKVSFLGTTKVERSMERISSLPEGIFFAHGYAPSPWSLGARGEDGEPCALAWRPPPPRSLRIG